MRIFWVLLLSIAGCASVPVDPNLSTLAASAERQQAAQLAHDESMAHARAVAATACASAADASACYLGQTAMVLASERGSGYAQQSPLAAYRAPASRMQQFGQFAAALTGPLGLIANAYVAVDGNRQNGRTTRFVAATNADRESNTVNAITGLGGVIANQQPGTVTTVTVAGNYGDTQTIGGNLGDTETTTAGRDQIGGDRTDNSGGVIGDGNDTRFGSPGPIDNTDPGNDCTGDGCQPIITPPPEVPPPGGTP